MVILTKCFLQCAFVPQNFSKLQRAIQHDTGLLSDVYQFICIQQLECWNAPLVLMGERMPHQPTSSLHFVMTGSGYIEEHKLSSSYPNNCGEDLKTGISRIQIWHSCKTCTSKKVILKTVARLEEFKRLTLKCFSKFLMYVKHQQANQLCLL